MHVRGASRSVLLVSVLASAGLSSPVPADDAPASGRGAADVDAALRRLAGAHELWPRFDPASVPLAVYDGTHTVLFRHPSPPEGYRPGSRGQMVREGRDPAVTANTSTEIGGVATATLLLDGFDPDRTLDELAAVGIHESFHVHQDRHHPTWRTNEANLFTYPFDDAGLLALRRRETAALHRAIDAPDPAPGADGSPATWVRWARHALELRAERFARMDSVHVAYERGVELAEGLATLVEFRALGLERPRLRDDYFAADAIRPRGYESGVSLAWLLERIDPTWEDALIADPALTLDEALRQRLAASSASGMARLPDEEVQAIERGARDDVSALTAERVRALEAFADTPGWRVIVTTDRAQRLWPRGFDPVNVLRIDDKILHHRFLKLGNELGEMSMLGARAVTDAAGEHPMWNGILGVEVAGLGDLAPATRVEGDSVHVEAGDRFTAGFRDATLVRDDGARRLTLCLAGRRHDCGS